MPFRPDVIRYRSNGTILGKRNLGKKTIDDVTGFYSYEAYMTRNQFGDYVDARGDGMDGPAASQWPPVNQVGPQTAPEGSF